MGRLPSPSPADAATLGSAVVVEASSEARAAAATMARRHVRAAACMCVSFWGSTGSCTHRDPICAAKKENSIKITVTPARRQSCCQSDLALLTWQHGTTAASQHATQGLQLSVPYIRTVSDAPSHAK